MAATEGSTGPGALAPRLVEFVGALRSRGIASGTGETVDAAEVVRVLGLSDRRMLREGLSAALLRRAGQREVFDAVFDIYFPAATGESTSAGDTGDLDIEQLRDRLVEALAAADSRALIELAQLAIDRFGQLGVPADGWSGYRALEAVQPQSLIARAQEARAEQRGRGADSGAFHERLEVDELRALVAGFRRMVQSEARRRSAEVRGRDRMTKYAVQPQTDRIDFLTANTSQLEELRRVVAPLARRLATRLAARRRRRNRGSIDIRKTLRLSMSTGGVPMNLAFARPHPVRPELVLLCDISGSVSGFSNFTMLLVQAMKGQFSKIRVFAFVNAMAEVTDLVESTGDDSLHTRIFREAEVTRMHTSSDYGSALGEFVSEHIDAVGPRSSVLVLGDARNNYRAPGVDALTEIAARSRRTFWLNPERAAFWGQGDSLALAYSDVVEMHECRTVEQLSQFVSRLLPV